jgi:hypothetical protein
MQIGSRSLPAQEQGGRPQLTDELTDQGPCELPDTNQVAPASFLSQVRLNLPEVQRCWGSEPGDPGRHLQTSMKKKHTYCDNNKLTPETKTCGID